MIGPNLGITGGGRPPWRPSRLASATNWWDPATGITLNGSDVSSWADRIASKALAQGTALKQPAYAATGGPFTGLANTTYVAAANDELTAATAADWIRLHNGAGGFIAMRYKATGAGWQVLADTCDWDATKIGFSIAHDGAAQRLNLVQANGTIGQVLDAYSAGGSVTNNASHTLLVSFLDGGSPEYNVWVDGTSVLSGTWANAPSASNPSYALTIGGRASSAGSNLEGAIADVIVGNAVPTAAERAKLIAYLSR